MDQESLRGGAAVLHPGGAVAGGGGAGSARHRLLLGAGLGHVCAERLVRPGERPPASAEAPASARRRHDRHGPGACPGPWPRRRELRRRPPAAALRLYPGAGGLCGPQSRLFLRAEADRHPRCAADRHRLRAPGLWRRLPHRRRRPRSGSSPAPCSWRCSWRSPSAATISCAAWRQAIARASRATTRPSWIRPSPSCLPPCWSAISSTRPSPRTWRACTATSCS